MEKAEALKLQPFFIYSFFEEAFARQGGQLKKREPGRSEITHVSAAIRSRDRVIGSGNPVLRRYQRICFQKDKTRMEGKPMADLLAPGHPLMDATLDLIQEQYRNILKQGAVLNRDLFQRVLKSIQYYHFSQIMNRIRYSLILNLENYG